MFGATLSTEFISDIVHSRSTRLEEAVSSLAGKKDAVNAFEKITTKDIETTMEVLCRDLKKRYSGFSHLFDNFKNCQVRPIRTRYFSLLLLFIKVILYTILTTTL